MAKGFYRSRSRVTRAGAKTSRCVCTFAVFGLSLPLPTIPGALSPTLTSRHLTRLVQQVFDAAFEKMKSEKGVEASQKLQEASTHWLHHTGASMEIERGRALKDLSEDLGHASMATTDTVYVQSEHRKRAESGKTRKV